MPANRSPNKTRALSCRKITRGLARGRKYYRRRFFARHPFPDPKIIMITRVRRGQGSARETLRRKNPERGSRPGFRAFAYIRQQAVQRGGCRGWGAVQPAHERQQHLCRGMGVPYGSPNNTTLERRIVIFHCALEQRDLYFGIYRWIRRPSRSRLNDLAAWLRASPTGIGLTRQFQLLICMTQLFFNFCWIGRLGNVMRALRGLITRAASAALFVSGVLARV